MTSTFLPSAHFVGLLLDDAIDEVRCVELLADLERRGFEATGEHYPRDYRDNDRLVFDDPALAASLYAQLGDHLPHELVIDGVRWRRCGLNSRFRACRYRGGQAFCIHRDGPHVPADDVRSHLTLQLYLDDAPDRAGGRTRFYADPRGAELWAAITPRRGAAIVFDHRAWHDGEAVTAGAKHVLRTDVMYHRIGAPAIDRDVVGRHRGYAWRVIACRDGSLASSGRDGTVRRWGRTPRTYDLGAGSVTALVEDPRGRLWGGTRSGVVAVIDGDTVMRVAEDVGAALGVCVLGERVVLATSRGTLLAFEAASIAAPAPVAGPTWVPTSPAWTSEGHQGWAWAAVPVGDSTASCGEDGRIAITDRAGRTRTLAELGVPLRALASLGTDLLAGDTRGWLHRVGPDGGTLASIRAHDGTITSVAIVPDGTWVTGSEDGCVKRWRDGQAIATTKAADFVTSVAIDARGEVACAGYDGAIWIVR